MANRPYRVLPNKHGTGGKWMVKRHQASRPASKHSKKSAAIKKAKRLARKQRVGIIVHRKDGTVQRGMDHRRLCG